MDTNSRQNWSTQDAQHAAQSQAQRAQQAQAQQRAADAPRDLTQNTAFGTADKPEGFVQTWRKASHTWRWRAVLCVFLALLLLMMQPTGNALYRSWNAATGEAQGLGAAFAGEQDLTNGTADFMQAADDAGAGGGEASSSRVDADNTYLIFGKGKIRFYPTVDDETLPALHYANFPGDTQYNGSNLFDNEGNQVAGYVAAYPTAEDGEAERNMRAGWLLYDSSLHYDNKYVAIGDIDLSGGKTYELTPTAANGMMGAYNAVAGKADTLTFEDLTASTKYPTNDPASGDNTPAFTALGYSVDSWIVLRPEKLYDGAISLKELRLVASDAADMEEKIAEAKGGTNFVLSSKLADGVLMLGGTSLSGAESAGENAPALQRDKEAAIATDLSSADDAERWAYAIWAPNLYRVEGRYGDEWVYRSGNGTNDYNLTWVSPLTVSVNNDNASVTGNVEKALNSDLTSWVVVNSATDLTPKKVDGKYVSVRGNTNSPLYSLLNPFNSTAASVDPGDKGVVYVAPYNTVTFHAGNGKGGRTDYFQLGAATKSGGGSDGGGGTVQLYASNNGGETLQEMNVDESVLILPYDGTGYVSDVENFLNGTGYEDETSFNAYNHTSYLSVAYAPCDGVYSTIPAVRDVMQTILETVYSENSKWSDVASMGEEPNSNLCSAGYIPVVSGSNYVAAVSGGGSSSGDDDATYYFESKGDKINAPDANDVGEGKDFQAPDSSFKLVGWSATLDGDKVLEPGEEIDPAKLTGSRDYYAIWGRESETTEVSFTDSNGAFTIGSDNPQTIVVNDVPKSFTYSNIRFNAGTYDSETDTYTATFDDNGAYIIEGTATGATTVTKAPTTTRTGTDTGYWSGGSITSSTYPATLATPPAAQAASNANDNVLTYTHTADIGITVAADAELNPAYQGTLSSTVADNTINAFPTSASDATITVKHVPLGITYDTMGFTVSGDDYIYSETGPLAVESKTYTPEGSESEIALTGLTKTPANASSYASTGTWSPAITGTVAGNATLTFSFSQLYTLTLVTDPATGTFTAGENTAATSIVITGVPSGVQYSAISFKKADSGYEYAESSGEGTYTIDALTKTAPDNYDTSGYWSGTNIDSTNAKPATLAEALEDATAEEGEEIASAMPTSNTTLTFTFARLYDVDFMQENGTTKISDTQHVVSGSTPTAPAAPEKGVTAQYTYTFDGWRLSTDTSDTPTLYGGTSGNAIPAVTGDVTYVAHYSQAVNKYTVTWKANADDEEALETDADVTYGSTPSYGGEAPTKTADAEWTYTFDGWQVNGTGTVYNTEASGSIEAFPTVSSNVTYVAHFAQTKNKYTVTLTSSTGKFSSANNGTVFADATTLTISGVPYGTSYNEIYFTGDDNGATALQYSANSNNLRIDQITTAPASAKYGGDPTWSGGGIDGTATSMEAAKTSENETPTVTGNTTLTLTYGEATYKVTWKANVDDTTPLETDTNVAYGATPKYDGTTPSQDGGAQYNYAFDGWQVDGTGTVCNTVANAEAGIEAFQPVSGDVTYVAHFTQTTKKYTITWKDGNGDTLKTEDLEYGTTPSYSGTTPTKTTTKQYTYTFNNTWSPSIATVSQAATYTAQFDSTVNSYSIKFYDEDGTSSLGDFTKDYGASLVGAVSTTPTKTSTDSTTYTFDGWLKKDSETDTWGTTPIADANLGSVEGNAEYKAHYAESDRTYNITVTLVNPGNADDAANTYNGHAGKTFTIEGVPYSVAFENVRFNWKSTDSEQADYQVGTYAAGGAQYAVTNASGENVVGAVTGGLNTSGTGWSPATSTTAQTAQAFTYTFGTDSYTVTYIIDGGTWANGYTTSGDVTRTDDTTLTQAGYAYSATVNDTGVPSKLTNYDDGAEAVSGYTQYFTPTDTASSRYVKTLAGDDTTLLGQWYVRTGSSGSYSYSEVSGSPFGKTVNGDVTYVYALTPVHKVTWNQAKGTDATAAQSAIEQIQVDQVYGTNVAGVAATNNTTTAPAVTSPGDGYNDRGWYEGTTLSDTTEGAASNALGTGGTITPDQDLTYTRYFKAADVTYYIVIEKQSIADAKSENAKDSSVQKVTNHAEYTPVVIQSGGSESAGGITVPAGTNQDTVVRTAVAAWATAHENMFSLSTYDMNWSAATASDNGTTFTLAENTNGQVASTSALSFTPTANNQAILVYFTRDKHTVKEKYTYTDGGTTADTVPSTFDYLTAPDANTTGTECYYEETYTLTDTSTYTPTVGYTFGGWKAASASAAVAGGTMGAADVTYTGDWTRNDVSIIVHNADPSAGSITVAGATVEKSDSDKTLTISGKYKYGDTVSAGDFTTTPNTGKAFSDWYTAESGTTQGSFATVSPLKPTTSDALDTNLWAQWLNTYGIVYRAGEHAGSGFQGWNASKLTQDVSLQDYGYTAGGTKAGDATGTPGDGKTRALTDITTAADGYRFSGWSWEIAGDTTTTGSWSYDDDATDASGYLNNPVYTAGDKNAPANGTKTLTGTITVTANYEGTAHTVNVTKDGAAAWNGGTLDSSYTGTGTVSDGATVKTGDTIKLPTASQLTKTGYTLTSYTVTQDGATYGTSDTVAVNAESTSNIELTIDKGASPFTGAITITANFTPNTHTVSFGWTSDEGADDPVSAPTTLTTDASTTATYATQYNIPADLYTTEANKPAGHTLVDATPFVVVPTDKVAEYKAGTYTTGITVSGNATDGYYIAAADVPDADFTVLTNWTIDQYAVTWALSTNAQSDYGNDNDKLSWSVKASTEENATTGVVTKRTYVKYGTTYESLLDDAPTLVIGSGLTTKYKPVAQATWAPLMAAGSGFVGDSSSDTENKMVRFILTPAEYSYNVQVSVVNGTATIGSTTASSLTFSYNTAYGTEVKGVTHDAAKTLPLSGMNVARTDGNYEETPTWTLQVNTDDTTGTAASATAPMSSSTPVTGYMIYTATFPQKSYTLSYTLASEKGSSSEGENPFNVLANLDGGATTLSKPAETDSVLSGKTMTQAGASAPELQNATAGFVAAKYGNLKWYSWNGTAKTDVTAAVNAGTLVLNDDVAVDSDSDGKKDAITLYAVPSVNEKTVTVHLVGGKSGAETTYTDSHVSYGTKIADVLPSTVVADFLADSGYSHNYDIAVWSNYGSGSFLADSVTGRAGLSNNASAPGNAEVTDNVELTLTFPAMRTITYAVANGAWDDDTTAAQAFYVPDGYTLATYYTTAEDDDDATAAVRHTGTTGFAAPAVGAKPASGYDTTGSWSRENGSTGIDPTDSGKTIADSYTAEAKGNVTYTYTYDPLSNLSVAITVHYQNKTTPEAASRGIASDYGADTGYENATVTLSNQTFGTQITVADLLAAISDDDPATGYIKVPVGFKRELADHSGDTGLSASGVKSTSVYRVAASDNAFDVYLDRYTVEYTYAFESTPTGFDAATDGPETPQTARYGETVNLWTTNQTYVSSDKTYAFQGWKVLPDTTLNKATYTLEPTATNNNTEFATTAFTGVWAEASYKVSYRLLTDTAAELQALDGKKLVKANGTEVLASFSKSEYDAGATLGASEENISVKPSGTTVAVGNTAKYEMLGWVYSVDGGATWKKSGDDYLVLDSPADVTDEITTDDFVFAPITQVRSYSVTFRAGPYALAQLNSELSAAENVINFTLKYGDAIPASPWVDSTDPTASNPNADKNQQTSATMQSLGFDANGLIPLNTSSYLRMFKDVTAMTSDKGLRTNWQATADTMANEYAILSGQTTLTSGYVGGDIEYQWKYPDQAYVIYFMNIDDTDLWNEAVSKATTTLKAEVTGDDSVTRNAMQWTGDWNGRDAQTDVTITWNDSIFKNMDKDTTLAAVKKDTGERTVSAWLNPDKEGSTFDGWVIGTNAKAADYTAQAPGSDIAVKDVWASTFNQSGGGNQVLYVWATWADEPATLTYHNNFTNDDENAGKYYANEGLNLTSATGVQDKTASPQTGLTTNTAATLATVASLGSDFTPTGYTFLGWTDREYSATSQNDARTSTQAEGALWADGGSYDMGTATEHDLYAVYRPNTFKVQWTDFSGNEITVQQAIDAGVITDTDKASYGYESDADTDVFTQTITYNATSGNTLAEVSKVFASADQTFVKWTYGTRDLQDGDDASTLASADGATVVLEAHAKDQYTLTYVYNGGKDGTATSASETKDVLASGDDGWDEAHDGMARFDLTAQSNAIKDSRSGYTLTGWKLGSTTYGTTGTVYLDSENTTNGKAQIEAQWEAATAEYTVVRHYPKSANAADGYVEINTAANVPERTTGGSTAITATEAAAFIADDLSAIQTDAENAYDDLSSYNASAYAFDSSSCTDTTMQATGTVIDVYYKLNTFTVTYRYMGASGYTPNPSSETVIVGESFTLPETGDTLPSSLAASGKWQVLVQGSRYTLTDVGAPGEEITPDNNMYPTGDVTMLLTISAAKYTVTFQPDGETAVWANGGSAGNAQTVEGGKYPQSSLVPELARAGADDGTYELVWTSSLTGSEAKPFATAVTGDVTYTASYKLINVVSFSLGDHAKYAATGDNDVTSYTGLASTYSMSAGQKADGGTYGKLKLVVAEDPGIVTTAGGEGGKPTAAAGWKFVGWEQTDTEGNVVREASELLDLSDVYALTGLEKSYTFTAKYTETKQRVTFTARTADHASASETSYVWGYTGSDTSAGKRDEDAALPDSYLADGAALTVPAAPAAEPGYTFAGWQGTLDGVSVVLGTDSDNRTFSIPEKDTELTAVYEPISVEMNFSSANSTAGKVVAKADGTAVDSKVTTTALSSVAYTAKATPQPGYRFTGWASATDPTFNLLDAEWYAVEDNSGKALAKDDPAYGLLTVGKTSDTPAQYFSGDYVASFTSDPYKVRFVSKDDTKLTVSPTYYGNAGYQTVRWGQKPDLSGTYGNSVTVTPVNAGYSFDHWEYTMYEEYVDGDTLKTQSDESTDGHKPTTGTTLDPSSVTIYGDTVFTAVYTTNAGSVSFSANTTDESCEGLTAGYSNVMPGTDITIREPGFTWPGHSFLGWSKSSTATTADADYAPGKTYTTQGGDETFYAVWSVDKATIVYHNGADSSSLGSFASDSTNTSYQDRKYFVANISASVEVPGATAMQTLTASVWKDNESPDTSDDEANHPIYDATKNYAYMNDANWDGVPGYVRFDTRVPGYARTLAGWATTEGGAVVYKPGDTIAAEDMPTGKEGDAEKHLWAVWTDTVFKVSFNSGGARSIDAEKTAPVEVVYGKGFTVPAVSEMYQYNRHTFKKWNTDSNMGQSTLSNDDGTAATFTFLGTANTTLTAEWELSSVEPQVVTVVFHNMTQQNNPKVGDELGNRAWSDMPMASGDYARLVADPDGYYDFRGWYATAPSNGGTAPDDAFAKAYGVGDTDGTTGAFTFDDAKTVEWLLQTFYNESQPLKNKVGQYVSGEPPVYWDSTLNNGEGDWTDAFWNVFYSTPQGTITIDLYGWADLKQYDVNFDANEPTTSAVLSGSVETPQVVEYKKNAEQALNQQDYSLPGYTFAYWLKPSGSTPGTSLANGTTAFEGTRYAANYKVPANGSMLTENEVNTGVHAVDLYAMWNESYGNSVVFNLTYDGDGAANRAIAGKASATVDDLAWRNGEVAGHANATIAVPSELDVAQYPDDDYWNYAFAGWYTEKDGGGVQIAPNSTMEDAVLKVLADDPDSDSLAVTEDNDGIKHYALTLYARWTATSATVVYDKNGGTPSGVEGESYDNQVAALGTDTTATTNITLRQNHLVKKGSVADGWKASPNFFVPASGTADTVYKGTVAFPNSLKDATVTMTANFVPREYTVEYAYGNGFAGTKAKLDIGGTVYDDIDGLGYSVSNKYKYGDNETTMHWADGYSIWPSAMVDPTLEGYTFSGYTVAYGDNQTLTLTESEGKGWTVQQLAERIAQLENPTLNEAQQAAAADDVRGTQDGSDKSYSLTPVFTPNNYTVVYDLGGAVIGNDTTKTTTGVHWADKDLLIDESAMSKPGYSNVKWYLDEEYTIPVEGDDPSLGDIAKQWHAIAGNESATFGPTVNLYAKWEEGTVDITFTLSKTAYGTVGDDMATPNSGTELTYIVGAASGDIYTRNVSTGELENTGTNITDLTVTATVGSSYAATHEVTGWSPATGNAATDTKTQFKLGGFNGVGEYVDATYEAQIEGKSYSYTANHLFQNADGSFDGLATVTDLSGVGADGGKLVETEDAAYGATFTKADLAKSLDGFTLDESGDGLTIGSGENSIELRYNRAQHDLSFDVVVKDSATTPAAPNPRLSVYYQHEEALPGNANASDDLPAVSGYKFAGWYQDWDAKAQTGTLVSSDKATATFTMPDEDVTLTAVYERDTFKVTVSDVVKYDTGSVDANGNPVYANASSATPAYTAAVANAVTMPVEVTSGSTLADTGTGTDYNMVVGGKTLGASGGTLLSTVTHNTANETILWMIADDDTGDILGYTDDPTSEVISANVTFTPIVTRVWLVKYLPGDHGDFTTSKAAGTLIEVTPEGHADGYALAEYLYPDKNDYSVEPAGKPGYVFDGWQVKYGDYDSGSMHYTNEQIVANTADFGALKANVTLTAMWKPGDGYLKFELNAPAQGVTGWSGDDPSGYHQTESAVSLPDTAATDADGWTLSGWAVYEIDGTTETKLGEYAAGKTFQMPGTDSTESDPTLVARAIWAEEYATVNYVSSSTKKGTVTTGSEQIGYWTGTPKSGSAVKGSTATPTAGGNYAFEGWTLDTADGDAVTTATPGTIALGDLAKDASGKYLDATYVANFKGIDRTVQFLVGDDSFIDNDRAKPMGKIWGYNYGQVTGNVGDRALVIGGDLLKQVVEYGSPIDIAKYGEAVPENDYKLKSGNCWDYEVYDAEGGTLVESGTLTDAGMRAMEITGAYTVFTAHFALDEGDYIVNWWGRNGVDENGKPTWKTKDAVAGEDESPSFTSKSTWGRTVSTSRTVSLVGYKFTGWFADVPPAAATVDDGSAAYNAQPGSTLLDGQSYGTLAGGTYATDAPEGTKHHIDLRAGWEIRDDFKVIFKDNAVDDAASPAKAEVTWTADNVKWNSETADGYTVDSAPYTARVNIDDYLLGYTFDGWWTQRVGGEKVFDVTGDTTAEYSDLVNGDESVESVTVFAHWVPKVYYVAYQSEWGYEGSEHTYGSGTDDDPFVIYEFTIDSTTSVDGSQTSLVIAAPENDDENWAWKEWQYSTGAGASKNLVALPSNWTVRDLMRAGANTAVLDGKACYLIEGDWNSRVVWQTKYDLFDNVGTPAAPNLQPTYATANLEEVYADKLLVTSYGMEGAEVAPNFNYEIPGFMAATSAAQAKTIQLNDGITPTPTDLDGVKVTLERDVNDPSKVVHTFHVALVPKMPYTLSFSLNDAYTYASGTHAAMMTSDPDDVDEGESVVVISDANVSELDQGGKSFLSIDNTPHYQSADDPDELLYYLNPMRPGFKFGGWFNVAIDDASGTNVSAEADDKAIESIGGEDGNPENQQTLYGDLSRDADGAWSDPGINNGITLYAKWVELTRTVFYTVASDQSDLVTMRLNSEDDSKYSTEARSEIIGAATGDKFDASGTRLVNADGSKPAQGAIAKTVRGYTVKWKIVTEGDVVSPEFEMPLTPHPDGVISASAASVVASAAETVAAVADMVAASASADMGAASMGAADMAAADGDSESMAGETATSNEGQDFSATDAITPGVRIDDGSNLFAGEANGDDDSNPTAVMYMATAAQNDDAAVTVDPGDGSDPATTEQPYGTYIGEKPDANGHYGKNDGALPDAPTRDGYEFAGWKATADTVAYNPDGTVAATLKAGDVVTGDEPWAGRIEVPEGGIGLEAQWTEEPAPEPEPNPEPDAEKHVVKVPETTLGDGTVVPGIEIEAVDGEPLTADQIEQIVNRDGNTPDKWNIVYTDPTTGVLQVKEGLTTDELRELLASLPIKGDVTITPASDAKVDPYIPPATKDPTVRPPAGKSNTAKTGDQLPILPIASVAIAAALLLLLLTLTRRRRDH